MVSGACRDAVGDRYVFRDLGALQVKGKLSATPVFELLGRKGEVPADQISYAAQFAAGVTEFARAQWPAARAVFQRCAVDFPNDRAVDLYLAEIERFETHPDLAGSVPALQLTSK
jgi:adenylate cyclase